jgi:hypothetical protein
MKGLVMPTHFRSGVSSALPGETLFEYPFLDPTKYQIYFNDCFVYTATEWTETATSVGAGTSATAQGTTGGGGEWLMTGAANENDGAFYNLVGEHWLFDAAKKFFFKARWKLSDATQSDAAVGVGITDTTPTAVSDGLMFTTADGDADILFTASVTAGTTVTSGLGDLVDDTYVTTGFFYDPQDALIHLYVNDVKVAESVSTNAPADGEALTLAWGSIAGAAGVDTSTWDYFLVARER